jgi:hypothetical protein
MIVVVDHIALALQNLRGHHAKNLDMRALAIAGVSGLQELEAVELAIIEDTTLDTAVGANLDRIGRLLNLTRITGDDDTTYRLKLRAQILLLRCSGTPKEIYEIFDLIAPLAEVGITPEYPAKFRFSWVDPPLETDAEAKVYGVILLRARAGGVGCYFYSLTADADDSFAFASDAPGAAIPWGDEVWGDGVWGGASYDGGGVGANGFSDTDQLTGGQLARIWFL